MTSVAKANIEEATKTNIDTVGCAATTADSEQPWAAMLPPLRTLSSPGPHSG